MALTFAPLPAVVASYRAARPNRRALGAGSGRLTDTDDSNWEDDVDSDEPSDASYFWPECSTVFSQLSSNTELRDQWLASTLSPLPPSQHQFERRQGRTCRARVSRQRDQLDSDASDSDDDDAERKQRAGRRSRRTRGGRAAAPSRTPITPSSGAVPSVPPAAVDMPLIPRPARIALGKTLGSPLMSALEARLRQFAVTGSAIRSGYALSTEEHDSGLQALFVDMASNSLVLKLPDAFWRQACHCACSLLGLSSISHTASDGVRSTWISAAALPYLGLAADRVPSLASLLQAHAPKRTARPDRHVDTFEPSLNG